MDKRGLKEGYRSGLEEKISKQLEDLGIDGQYEQHKIKFVQPAKERTYTPDFKVGNVYIETKGRFVTADRQKHLMIKKDQPELDIRFVFQNSRQKLYKGAKSTYADWCTKHGFLFADKLIPEEWLNNE